MPLPWAGLGSVEVAAGGQGAEDAAPDGEAQGRSRAEADCQTNRAVIAAVSQGLAAGDEAEQQLQGLAEAAGAPEQHVLLLALCHACVSGRATRTGAARPCLLWVPYCLENSLPVTLVPLLSLSGVPSS